VEGHGGVDYHQVEAAGGQELQGPFPIGGQDGLVTGCRQGGPGGQEGIRLVVDDEDPGHYPPATVTPSPSTIRPTS
jgi:hypothetical protein